MGKGVPQGVGPKGFGAPPTPGPKASPARPGQPLGPRNLPPRPGPVTPPVTVVNTAPQAAGFAGVPQQVRLPQARPGAPTVATQGRVEIGPSSLTPSRVQAPPPPAPLLPPVAPPRQTVDVTFRLCYGAQFGERLKVIGSDPALGMGNPLRLSPPPPLSSLSLVLSLCSQGFLFPPVAQRMASIWGMPILT
jgi:hypothetical protein